MMKIDKIDKEILAALSKDARATLKDMAQITGLSSVAVHQRLKKLEDQQLIKAYRIELDYNALGYGTMVLIGIFLERAGLYRKVLEELKKVPEVLECNFTTGTYSLLVKIICKDNIHLMELLNDKVQSIKGVARTETFVILETGIDRTFTKF